MLETDVVALEKLIGQLAETAPSDGLKHRDALGRRLAELITDHLGHERLEKADFAAIESKLKLLKNRLPSVADELSMRMNERRVQLQRVVELQAPFAEIPPVLSGTHLVTTDGTLTNDPKDSKGSAVVLTTEPCIGNLRCEVTLWLANPQEPFSAGILLNAHQEGTKSHAFVVTRAGQVTMASIVRNGVVQRQMEIQLSSPILRIMAERDGETLALQVLSNDQPLGKLTFQDVFAIAGSNAGNFAIAWPRRARLEAFSAWRQSLSFAASSLERGDNEYEHGNFKVAVEDYRHVAETNQDSRVRDEAKYKEALCLLGLGNEHEAERLFTGIATGRGNPRWVLLARIQLVMLCVQANRVDEMQEWLESLRAEFGLEQIASLVPHATRMRIRDAYRVSGGLEFLRPDPKRTTKLEQGILLDELCDITIAQRYLTQRMLLRAYHADGKYAQALELAERMSSEFAQMDDPHFYEEYMWLLCLQDRVTQAKKASADWLRKGHQDQVALLAAVRLDVKLGNWDQAAARIDEYFLRFPQSDSSHPNDVGAAWLMRGLLLDRKGETDAARQTWRKGYLAMKEAERHWEHRSHNLHTLYKVVLGSLSDSLSDADEDVIVTSVVFGGNTAFSVLRGTFQLPAGSLRKAWQTSRGKEAAMDLGFFRVGFDDLFQTSLVVVALSVACDGIHEEAWSPDLEEHLWQAGRSLVQSFLAGKHSTAQLLQLALAWKGNTSVIGWSGISPSLSPVIRGPLALALGHRFQKLGRVQDSRMFFESAAADAMTTNNDELQRLAEQGRQQTIPK
ncbi:tetratricopeptide repeat protein [Anatilimnocola aggregata]|uniref:tetratricopeptide repeat protein n=1 Tax=Anatilimnocola aggregata TaxID=2528021 RepID=UPI001EE4843D|nr:tetratricopeptide repeat protein [Anatilimnocola aggregata]